MPAFTTHYLYGVDLFGDMTSTTIKTIIRTHIGAYRLGLQGPDLFFYDPLCMIMPKESNIGSLLHETKASLFYRHYLTNLKRLRDKESRETMLAYLCGFLAHYTLDRAIHPYVYSKVGYQPDGKIPAKYYFGSHGELEAFIDFILLKEHKESAPSLFHPSKTIHLRPKELLCLSDFLSRTLKMTYPNIPGTSVPGVGFAYLCTKFATSFLHSYSGRRKRYLLALERQFLSYHLIGTMIVWDGMEDTQDAMNRSHNEWKNPWNETLISRESVDELYQKAKENYLAILPLLEDYYLCPMTDMKAKKKPLEEELGNFSYHSGLECES